MEESLAGGRGPPRAVVPLERELKNTDTTGKPTLSRTSNQLISGLDLYDAWEDTENANAYTHYTQHGASRLDRIYTSRTLLPTKNILNYVPLHLHIISLS
jgi:hypothetical protein